MSLVPIKNLTIRDFHDGLLNKDFTALEATENYYTRIREKDPSISAYLSTREEAALREAEQVDLAIAQNEEVPLLAGVPLAVKDNILFKGEITTAASKMLETYTASYDATATAKLKAHKAVFLGKTNLDEFAMGSSTENSAFQITKNPRDPTRVPGGSSGGSAAAVAADMAVAALGSDTGGSICQPAAFCGVVGLKPTYGAVSRSGLIAMASGLDQIGPIAKTVEDAAILFDAIRGKDPLDATSAEPENPEKYQEELLNPDFQKIKKLRVGLPKEYFDVEGLAPEIRNGVERAIEKMKGLGIAVEEISLPHTKYAVPCYYIIVPAEVSSNLARFDGIRYSRQGTRNKEQGTTLKDIYLRTRGEGFGAEPKRRIILGTFVLSSGYYDAYYDKAQRVRALIKRDFEQAFEHVGVILTPLTPTLPFKIGEKVNDPLAMYLEDIFTLPLNLAGLPGLSLPVENRDKGQGTRDKDVTPLSHVPGSMSLPVGFQLIGKPFHEPDILGLGRYYQENS
ncbi:MAG: Asp-tRNA(Asn)/Glu-tRNA(Gln) amidotransferase subunit GatA [Candidatus Liptonbacteria bacterium]|nr:Asp-tRNA(Asn)/Glu-tRNA(Gln) amidotransferase subunit GatA [Candidatus Liptonbacteria bacterium]